MILVFYTVHVALSLFLILVVLLQQGKGADLSVFGGGASQAAFGARGAATLLHKLTVACFVLFMMTTLSISILQNRGGASVMSGVDPVEVEAAAPETAPAPAPEPESMPADTDGTATGDSAEAEPAPDGSNNQG